MAATQTLDTNVRETVRPSGHQAHEFIADAHTEPKRNGRKHRKAPDSEHNLTTPTAAPPHETPAHPNSTATEPTKTSEALLTSAVEQTAPAISADKPSAENSAAPADETKSSSLIVESEDSETVKPAVTLTPEMIVNFAHEANVRFFQDQHGNVFAWVPVTSRGQEHYECLGIKTRTFLARLLELIRERTASMPQLSTLKQAIEILQLEAYRAPRENLCWSSSTNITRAATAGFLGHKNGDLNDNRIENLIVVDQSTRNANAPRHRDNSTGFKGVTKARTKFTANVGWNNEQLYLGTYDRACEAAHAVNFTYDMFYPDIPTPNRISPGDISPARRGEIEENVLRLLHPRRAPRKRKAN